jgi:hypothetical protein
MKKKSSISHDAESVLSESGVLCSKVVHELMLSQVFSPVLGPGTTHRKKNVFIALKTRRMPRKYSLH